MDAKKKGNPYRSNLTGVYWSLEIRSYYALRKIPVSIKVDMKALVRKRKEARMA